MLATAFTAASIGGPIVLLGVDKPTPVAARHASGPTVLALVNHSTMAVASDVVDERPLTTPAPPTTVVTDPVPTTAPAVSVAPAEAVPVAHTIEEPVTTTTTEPPPPPPTTTTTAPAPTTTTAVPPSIAAGSRNQETGDATWYAQAPPGDCASPTLPFGTVVQVTNNATGASTTCTVDDRMAATAGRIIDLSQANFSQIANLSQGVVAVTITW